MHPCGEVCQIWQPLPSLGSFGLFLVVGEQSEYLHGSVQMENCSSELIDGQGLKQETYV